MYDLGPELDGATVAPGTNILIAGPPLSGKRRLAFDVLAAGAPEEAAVVVTARDSAERLLAESLRLPENTPLGIVDCVTRHRGQSAEDTRTVTHAASPTDMTGIGVGLSGFLDRFEARDLNVRVVLDSLSALLMYSDLQTVFRFMHVFTNRVEDAGGLGLYIVESTAHDEETMNTVEQLFDGVVEVDADGTVNPRLPGTDAELLQ